jgi:hypothetical protein
MSNASKLIELLAKDLNHQGGVFCPSPKADMKIWNTHPKVYLDVAARARPSARTAAPCTSLRPVSTSVRIDSPPKRPPAASPSRGRHQRPCKVSTVALVKTGG